MAGTLRKMLGSGHGKSGAALVELTVVLPVLLTIGLGVIEFGRLIYNYHLITVGVRDAVRYQSGFTDGANYNNAKCIALTGKIAGADCDPGASPSCTTACRVSWWNDAATVTFTPASITNDNGFGVPLYRGGATITVITASAIVAYSPFGMFGFYGTGAINLTTSHQERYYGVR